MEMNIIDVLKSIAGLGLKFVLPFVLAWAVLKAVDRTIDRALRLDQTGLKSNLAINVLRSLITALIWACAVFAAMSNIPGFGKTWQTVLTSASVASVVLGLAAQDTLSNVFAGISMSIGKSKPFSIGDRVEIGDADPGYVEAFTLRHVELVTYYQEHIFIPNSVVASARIVNYSRTTSYSHGIEIRIACTADYNHALEIMADVIAHHPMYAGNDSPWVTCKEVNEIGILLRGIMTTTRYEDNVGACSDCMREILQRFVAERIEIPYNRIMVEPESQG